MSELKPCLGEMLSPYEQGEWDMFWLITSVYFGKEYYFLNDDGSVYSRLTHMNKSREAAKQEFLDYLEKDL